MSASELLEEIKMLSKFTDKKRIKRKRENVDDYIKRKSRYKCNYCHKIFEKKKLNASLEPYHTVKATENIYTILEYYEVNKSEMRKLNPKVDLNKIGAGNLLRVPKYFKIIPKTHGICYCNNCGDERKRMKMDHVMFVQYLLEKRRMIRSEITPELKLKIFKRDQYKCLYCEIEFGETKVNSNLTIDHRNPIVGGGNNEEANLCTCCDFHNLEKSGSSYENYIKKIKTRRFYRENGVEI